MVKVQAATMNGLRETTILKAPYRELLANYDGSLSRWKKENRVADNWHYIEQVGGHDEGVFLG